MAIAVEAVYEQGALRLKEPIPLPEGAHVEVIVIAKEETPEARRPAEILADIAAMPMQTGSEEFSGRDHDRVLYGKKGAR